MNAQNTIKTGLVVLNYNDWQTTTSFISKIKEYNILDHIVVVDNNSSDSSFDNLKKYECDKITVIKSKKNGGYNYGNYNGVIYLQNRFELDYIIISNPDVEVSESAIEDCINELDLNSNIALIAPKMRNIDGTINTRSAWRIPSFFDYLLFSKKYLGFLSRRKMYFRNSFFQQSGLSDVQCLAGSFFIIRNLAEKEVKPFDLNLFLYGEEMTIGLRFKPTHWKVVLNKNCEFIHKHSVTIDKHYNKRAKDQMMWKSRIYILENYYKNTKSKSILLKKIKDIYSL